MSSPEFASVPALARERQAASLGPAYWPALAVFTGCMLVLLIAGDRWALPRVQDDAYYYLQIARNIATTGHSEFFPGMATNGYHPLWMAVLIAMGSSFGFSVAGVKALETLCVFVGIVLVLRAFHVQQLLASLCYTVLLWFGAYTFALNGMETALLVPGLAAFVGCLASEGPLVARRRALWLGLSAAFCIGARIDSALIVLPMLALSSLTRREKLGIAAALAALGLAYAGANLRLFGAPLPISGMAKSIGGLQLNRLYFKQLFDELTLLAPDDPLRPTAGPYIMAVLASALAIGLRRAGVLTTAQRRALLGALLGLALFYAKVGFFSPWAIWPWYSFPSFVFLLLSIWFLESTRPGLRTRAALVGLALPVAHFMISTLLLLRPETFPVVNRRFADEFRHVLRGRTVAMGDRAGSFAFNYPGGVFQLEGLVADLSYLEQLKRPGDLRSYLCARNVELVMSYERPLGDYGSHRVEALRAKLTTQPSPYLIVSQRDELAQLEDAAFREADNRLYLWDLRCHASGTSH
jgi:hypothetical protein